MTKGGLRKNSWVEINEIPSNRVASQWRYLLCKALGQAHPHDPDLQHAISQGYHDHRGFQVYTESFYPKGLEAAKYIGRL
jgi:hypothetical protein